MKYSLEIVSHLSESNNKVFRSYPIEGMDTIGVFGNESFEIRFKNHTGNKVQVRFSLDGTDILTGKLAHTDVINDGMWVVQPYGTMSLKAWPETDQKGREFVFTNENNSVAIHTHGNLSSKGIIAAAVYVEGSEPWGGTFTYPRFWWEPFSYPFTWGGGSLDISSGGSWVLTNDNTNFLSFNSSSSNELSLCSTNAPGVGAGEEIFQKISSTTGLVQPKLDSIIRYKYMWWDDLKAKLSQNVQASNSNPSGFPGDRERKLANLGSTPSVASKRPEVVKAEEAPRFA